MSAAQHAALNQVEGETVAMAPLAYRQLRICAASAEQHMDLMLYKHKVTGRKYIALQPPNMQE